MPEVLGTSKNIYGFEPRNVPGCVFWYDGADPNGTGTLPANGASVTTWVDKSGQGRNATAGTAPTWSNVNGVVFNGTNTVLNVGSSSGLFVNVNYTIFVVERLNITGTSYLLGDTTASGATSAALHIGYRSVSNLTFAQFADDIEITGLSGTGILRLWAFNSPSTAVFPTRNVRQNGVVVGTRARAALTAMTQLVIGSAFNSNFYGGTIHEIIGYREDITIAQIQQLEGYLAWKWGLNTSLVGGSITTPTQIPGCQLWLDASDRSSLGISITGIVGSWNDKSGNGRTMTVGSGNTGYTNPVSVNLNSSYMLNNSAVNLASYTTFIVAKQNSAVNNTSIFASKPGTAAVTSFQSLDGFGFYMDNQNTVRMYSTNALMTNSVSTVNPTLSTYTASGTTGASFINGATGSTLSSGSTRTTTAQGFSIGAEWNGSAWVNIIANASINEIIVYNSVLTEGQRRQVEGYLTEKWTLTRTNPSHPYAVLRPFTEVFQPTDISGCQLWFDAMDGSTTSNISTTWIDKSGRGCNATGFNTPTINTTGINGYPAVTFNGSSYFTGATTNTTPLLSVFIVATEASGITAGAGLFASGRAGFLDWNDPGSFVTGNVNGTSPQCVTTRNPINYQFYNPVFGTPFMFSMVLNGVLENSYLDGAIQTPSNLSVTSAFAYTNYAIGNRAGSTGNIVWRGFIGEVITYAGGLTNSQRQQVEGYLRWKWGTTALPTTQPFSKFPPLAVSGMPNYRLPFTPSVYLVAQTYTGTGTWFDLSPNGRNATIENGIAAKTTAGNGIVLNGSTNWQFSDIAAGNTWTLSVWWRTTGYTGTNPSIVTQIYPGSNNNINIQLGLGAVLGGSFYDGAGWRNGTPLAALPTVWTNHIITWNGTTLSTYTNGALFGATTPGGTSTTSGANYRIGRRWDGADYIIGTIGQVCIYKAALTANQVVSEYNNVVFSGLYSY